MSFFKQAYLSSRRSFHVTVARNDSSALVWPWPWVTTAASSAGKIGDLIISQLQDNRITKFSDKPQHHFQSRELELKRLKELTQSLQKERNQKYPNTAVTVYVSGLPGIGKTQLVGDFARRTYDQKSFFKRRKSFVGTLDASNKESFQQSYEELANLITPGNLYLYFGILGSQGELQSLKILSKAVQKEMSKNSRKEWLLVVDGLSVSNLDKDKIMAEEQGIPEEWIDQYLPHAGSTTWGRGTVIITTKDRNLVPQISPYAKELYLKEGMNEDDSLGLLHGITNYKDDENDKKLVETLNGIPLLIASAGAYIAREREIDSSYSSQKYCADSVAIETAEKKKLKPAYDKNMMEALIMKIKQDLPDDNLKKIFILTSSCALAHIPLSLGARVLNMDEKYALQILNKSMLFNVIKEDTIRKSDSKSTFCKKLVRRLMKSDEKYTTHHYPASFSVHRRVRRAMITCFQEIGRTGTPMERRSQVSIFQHVIDSVLKECQESEDNPQLRAMLYSHLNTIDQVDTISLII